MNVDDPPSNSPLVSQYGAQVYRQNECTQTGREHTTYPVHDSAEHNFPQDGSPVCTTQLEKGNQSNDEASPDHCAPKYDTSAAPPNLHGSSGSEPRSTAFQDMLFRSVHIHSPICPDPITPTQPRYDSSSHTTSRRACLFPLSPQPFRQEHSLNKSSDNISGFAPHAATINAFSATAIAVHPVTPPPSHSGSSATAIDQVQNDGEVLECDGESEEHDGNVVELSDDSPPRRVVAHEPSMEENHVADELRKCATVPAPKLICPLDQTVWDIFESMMTQYEDAFHITPSDFAFSNKFLLELAVPMQWTRSYVSDLIRFVVWLLSVAKLIFPT
ncbi:hypothetical protein Bca52824_002521 [Brassica carinata]|uniref:Uncharacterized protein n=1 Tax=Brassica carinata TaxID=52824 RepID=A0A8X7WKU8_BRACI|nr:hypothetical protein Bca52824_002521 [Brassica carinata]